MRAIPVCLACACLLSTTSPAAAQAPVSPVPALQDVDTESRGPALGSIFTETVGSFERLASDDTLMWLGAGAMVAAFGHSIDHPVSRGMSDSAALDGVFEAGATIGGARLQLAGALATYGVGRLARTPKVAGIGADLLQAQIVAQTLTAGVKLSVRRARPDGTQYSFPSGHTSVTFASATVLQRRLGWKAGLPAYGVATYVAASRINAKRHFLADVAFGAAIGIVAGRTATFGSGGRRFSLSPQVVPGGGGITMTWSPQR